MTDNTYSLRDSSNILKAKEDKEYAGKLIKANEDLIWFTIHKYMGKPFLVARYNSMEKEDLFQVGCIGFLEAIDRFDSERGILFTTYAPAVICGTIKSYIRDKGKLIRLPRRVWEFKLRLSNYIVNGPGTDFNYDELVDKLAKDFKIDKDEVTKLMSMSLNVVTSDYGYCNYAIKQRDIEQMNPLEDVENRVVEDMYLDYLLETVRSKLSDRDNRILTAKIEGKTHAQIADKEDIAKITVTRALKKVKNIIENITDE